MNYSDMTGYRKFTGEEMARVSMAPAKSNPLESGDETTFFGKIKQEVNQVNEPSPEQTHDKNN